MKVPLNIDPWDESIGIELRLPTIDDIATWTHKKVWCTGVEIINPADEVVKFNEPRYHPGVSWPPSYRANIYAVDPGLVMYANELVIVYNKVMQKFRTSQANKGEVVYVFPVSFKYQESRWVNEPGVPTSPDDTCQFICRQNWPKIGHDWIIISLQRSFCMELLLY